MMIRDPIIEEVREVRRSTEEACGGDWEKLMEHDRRVPTDAGRVIRREPKRLPKAPAVKRREPG